MQADPGVCREGRQDIGSRAVRHLGSAVQDPLAPRDRAPRPQALSLTVNPKTSVIEAKLHVEKGNLALGVPPSNMGGSDKAEWFREQFKKTHLFVTLVSQFDQNEVDIYMEEYGHICCQFEDIVVSEYFQIDSFLKHRILINRQLTAMKKLEAEIDEVVAWIAHNPLKGEASKEERQERMERFRHLEGLRSAQNKAHERYDKLVSEWQRMYQSLAATRRDRIDELKGGGESFFSLVSMIQTSEAAREQHGRYAEMTRIAAGDINREFRKSVTFPDGSKDPIILDAETLDIEDSVPDEEIDQ